MRLLSLKERRDGNEGGKEGEKRSSIHSPLPPYPIKIARLLRITNGAPASLSCNFAANLCASSSVRDSEFSCCPLAPLKTLKRISTGVGGDFSWLIEFSYENGSAHRTYRFSDLFRIRITTGIAVVVLVDESTIRLA